MTAGPLDERISPERGVILLGDPADTAEAGAWPIRLAAIRHETPEQIARDFDIIIPADHLTRAPLLKAGMRVAFLVHDLEALERLLAKAGDPEGPILFAPTPLALLELHRLSRTTLKAARPIPSGAILEAADIAEEKGGSGISADLRDTIVGKKTLYALGAGAALDFGVMDEDDWRRA